jgi:DHA2 family multidrug resistance protein
MLLSPGAIVIILLLPLVGRMIGRIDARYLIAFGFLAASIGLFHMTNISLQIDFKSMMLLRVYQMIGVAFLFVPIQTMSYVGIPPEKNNNVSGMTNLARNMGGSIGISLVENMLSSRSQFHQSVLSAHTGKFDIPFQSKVANMTQMFANGGMDHATAAKMAYARVYGMVQAQAAMLAYVDTIWIFAIVCLLVVPLSFLMKKSNTDRAPASLH